jgi:tRNA C32,U32 (ribose-2'-O)-methylase TrmJ
VCLYELVRQTDVSVASRLTAMASVGETERLTALLAEVLEKTEYTRHHPANSDEAQIRRLVMRLGLTATDVPVWMGILRQVMWKLRRTEAGGE